ncbi:hypothetical protein HPB47_011296 [Ixodes persulcatus]|uniref:Uncharacterized protein n=1 Tax=Ixodes persulcatus TaxID=34615 RepID=A0AC60NWN1_IXOPE|nr:hypothetical protein HPB47_011296 [Ixodes persulcatus]
MAQDLKQSHPHVERDASGAHSPDPEQVPQMAAGADFETSDLDSVINVIGLTPSDPLDTFVGEMHCRPFVASGPKEKCAMLLQV